MIVRLYGASYATKEERHMEDNAVNYYGQPIIPPEHFDGEHFARFVPAVGGLPPVCSCGWTRHEVDGRWYELADHLADMNASTTA